MMAFPRQPGRNRILLSGSALILVLNVITPGFQEVLAASVDELANSYCTMYSTQPNLDGKQADKDEKTVCFECPLCLIQANLNSMPGAPAFAPDPDYSTDTRFDNPEPSQVSIRPPYARFHSRAPPPGKAYTFT